MLTKGRLQVPGPSFHILLFTLTSPQSLPPHQDRFGGQVRNKAAENINPDNKASNGDEEENERLCYENSAPAFLRAMDAICAPRSVAPPTTWHSLIEERQKSGSMLALATDFRQAGPQCP